MLLSDSAASAAVDAVVGRLNSGKLRLYAGDQPVHADTSTSQEHVLLAELTFGIVAFAAAVQGVAKAHPLSPEKAAMATGTATWFRATTEVGEPVFDGSVGTTRDKDLVLKRVDIDAGCPVHVTEFRYSQGR